MGDGVAGARWPVHEVSRGDSALSRDPGHGADPGQGGDAQLVDHIVREIRDRVFVGTLPVGTWLRQEAIAAEFAVSRTPVREALRELQARGIVSLLPNRGALVRGPTLKEIREAYAVRAELEGLAARLAASRVSAADLDRLRQAEALFEGAAARLAGGDPQAEAKAGAKPAARLAGGDPQAEMEAKAGAKPAARLAGGDPQAEAEAKAGAGAKAAARTPPPREGDPRADPRDNDWRRANDLFHEVILAAAGNDRLRLMIADLHRALPRSLIWGALLSRAGELAENAAQHRRIREALQAGDGEEARGRMIQHVAHAGSLVEAWFASHLRAWPTDGRSENAAEAARER
jgi:DNA-binding GntR family transcriptional regulator